MKSLIMGALLLCLSGVALADCKGAWVDDDSDIKTAPIRMQVCDSIIKAPIPEPPTVPAVQARRIVPIQPPVTPPAAVICTGMSVLVEGRFVTRPVCK
jgi:hypothetical protein